MIEKSGAKPRWALRNTLDFKATLSVALFDISKSISLWGFSIYLYVWHNEAMGTNVKSQSVC